MNIYKRLGIVLIAAGICVMVLSGLEIGSALLLGIGLSMVILGATSLSLGNTRLHISPEASQLLLKTGVENTMVILEELKVKGKAIYFPRNGDKVNCQALIPLNGEINTRQISEISPQHLLLKAMPYSEGMALAVTTPGNIGLEMLQSKPEGTEEDIQSALRYILTRELDIANGARVNLKDSRLYIEVTGSKINYEDKLYYRSLGSPIASIAAAISSEALKKPVRIIEESSRSHKSKIILEVLR